MLRWCPQVELTIRYCGGVRSERFGCKIKTLVESIKKQKIHDNMVKRTHILNFIN